MKIKSYPYNHFYQFWVQFQIVTMVHFSQKCIVFTFFKIQIEQHKQFFMSCFCFVPFVKFWWEWKPLSFVTLRFWPFWNFSGIIFSFTSFFLSSFLPFTSFHTDTRTREIKKKHQNNKNIFTRGLLSLSLTLSPPSLSFSLSI